VSQRPSVRQRREERELLFWSVRQVLGLVLFAALVVGVVAAVAIPLTRGETPRVQRVLMLP
jgi:uncharacterized integral membrane protein